MTRRPKRTRRVKAWLSHWPHEEIDRRVILSRMTTNASNASAWRRRYGSHGMIVIPCIITYYLPPQRKGKKCG